jgi:hypothetical protein
MRIAQLGWWSAGTGERGGMKMAGLRTLTATVRSNSGGDLFVDDGDKECWSCLSKPEVGVVRQLPDPPLPCLV